MESWRRGWGIDNGCFVTGTQMLRELAALVRPENAERIVCGQCVSGRTIATSQLHFRHHFDDHTKPSHCRHPPPRQTSTTPIATMSDSENGDELVTKPFKFVTGELFPLLRSLSN